MTNETERIHIKVAGATRRQLGRGRGEQLRGTLRETYNWYAQLYRSAQVTEAQERDAAEQTLATLRGWRPEVVEEFEGIAEGSGLTLLQVTALNARTEILALGIMGGKECSTVAARIGDRMLGVQTWDWHIELDPFWHTHEVEGPGFRFVGITEQGIISKIGMNSAGLGLHFNILGHKLDGGGGVPMHVLSSVVLSECATVTEAIDLVRQAPITSSSSFTLLDEDRAVSLEITPVGVFEIPQRDGVVVRTNHFQNSTPLESQKDSFEPDSSARFNLVQERLEGGLPDNADDLVALLLSGEGQPPLSCVPDMSKKFGERWATLCTSVTDPEARTIRVLDGMPTEAGQKSWRILTA